MSKPNIIKRFGFADAQLDIDLCGSGVASHWRKWGSKYFLRLHGDEEAMLDLSSRQDLKDSHNFQVLSDHVSTPADRMPARLLAYLASEGITPRPGDVILNSLRALRDKYERDSPNPFGFDIS